MCTRANCNHYPNRQLVEATAERAIDDGVMLVCGDYAVISDAFTQEQGFRLERGDELGAITLLRDDGRWAWLLRLPGLKFEVMNA